MSSSTIILAALLLVVTVVGFYASRWRAGSGGVDDWALGGRSFGTLISWFLIGGDCYTAYTFIALPALVYGTGAFAFFAVPYNIVVYPFAILLHSRFWTVARNRGYVTFADFVRDRFGDRWLELAIAFTGVLAILPYIALQVVGMKTVFLELGGAFAANGGALALAIAFVLLASYTYTSGLRAPALIAFVKDTLIYVTIIVALFVVTAKFGGWHGIFSKAGEVLASRPKPATLLLPANMQFAYVTTAIGSAIALYIYPHSITSVLASKSRDTVRQNMSLLPIYALLLGCLALLGYAGIAAGIQTTNNNLVVPMLFKAIFPDWFVGVAFAAIVIGALVPAAIMAIGGANLFASNIFNQFSPNRAPAETKMAKRVSFGLCLLALLFVFFVNPQYAIYFQFLGGAWILQIVPAFVIGLFTRWFHPKALLLGWFAGIVAGTAMAIANNFGANFPLHIFGTTLVGYVALYALILNLVVATLATLAFKMFQVHPGTDFTQAADYA